MLQKQQQMVVVVVIVIVRYFNINLKKSILKISIILVGVGKEQSIYFECCNTVCKFTHVICVR